MKQAVFVSRDRDQFAEVEQMLARKKINVEWTGTGKDALSLLSNTSMPIDLVVLAEELPDIGAKALVEAVIIQSPFTHCAVAGAMGKKEFHDHYEGYGVLMQLSVTPTPEDAAALGTHLDKLAGMEG